MKRIALSLAVLALAALAPAAEVLLQNQPPRFDNQGRFTLEVDVPAGSRHALLESLVPGPPASWRPLVAGAIDGRAAEVTFRLPANYAPKQIVRARTGPETTVPAAELNDPSLFTVSYESGIGEQVKIDFLRDAAVKMREWATLPRAESQAQLIAWANANPLVAEAVVSMPADNISIRFTDGDICILLNPQRGSVALTPQIAPAGTYDTQLLPEQRATAPLEIPAKQSNQITSLNNSGLGIPASKHAVTAHSLEAIFPDSAPTIGGWLTSAGYDVRTLSGTTVATVKSWSTSSNPLGVLFWQVHGCSFKKENGTESVALVTRQYASEALSKGDYKELRDSRQVLLAADLNQTVPYYTITSDFVRQHMHFAANSLVVIDACYGSNEDLAKAFIAAGAGSYASWDWESGKLSGEPCRKIFDRMLGTNEETPVSTVKERSFSQPIVQTWMWRKKYDFDPSPKYPGQTRPNATLIWKHHATNPSHILKPTILRILNQGLGGTPSERFSTLWLEGDFGDDPGEGKRNVMWGGQLQQVLKWEGLGRIYVRVPNPAPVGNVQVTVNRGYNSKSNEVPITQWTVPFTWVYTDAGSLTEKMDLTVKFRGDIHGERIYPEDPVSYSNVKFWCIADCSGTLSASGVYSPMEGVTLTYSGGSNMKSYDMATQQVPDGHLITNTGEMRGDGTFFNFHLDAGGMYKATYKYVLPDGGTMSQVVDNQSGFSSDGYFVPLPSFNSTYVFKAGNKTIPRGSGSATLSWPATGAVAIPTVDTAR
ncbi:hypothetical protein [Luteolibacter luteus]|uniref:Uncharacterized protein n=1 Tax=Luteolibacter luteus TaxID=2728835 RepID=A0A858RKA8_9BACT|nr:hypothetical protein [Luteolibacter luteus]QJE97292.1 hypothetical protein HHL09_16345 [Luteolibacter luteus]